MPMHTGRLKARHQFLTITKQGHKAVTKSFVVFCRFDFIETQLPIFQSADLLVGYTATKKLGNAVARNRIKRRLRAVMAEVMPAASEAFKGAGFVIVARHSALETDFKAMCEEARKCLNWLRKQNQ